MLSRREQAALLYRRMMRKPLDFTGAGLTGWYRKVWEAVEQASPGEEMAAAFAVLHKHPNRLGFMRELQALLQAEPGQALSLQAMGEQLKPVSWVWPGWIPRGYITLLGAVSGAGKSFVALDLTRRILRGEGWPEAEITPDSGPHPRPLSHKGRGELEHLAPNAIPGGKAPEPTVVYVDAEVIPQVIYERAQGWGPALERLFLVLPGEEQMLDLSEAEDQDRLVDVLNTARPALLVIDALSSVTRRGLSDLEAMRRLLTFLNQAAMQFDLGVLLIHHLRKAPTSGRTLIHPRLDDFLGAGYISAAARSALALRVVQTGPQVEPNGPRVLEVLKTNLGATPRPLGLRFAHGPDGRAFITWSAAPLAFRAPTTTEECAAWLGETLQAAGGPLRSKEIMAQAEALGFNRRTVYRARRLLGDAVQDTLKPMHPENEWIWQGEL